MTATPVRALRGVARPLQLYSLAQEERKTAMAMAITIEHRECPLGPDEEGHIRRRLEKFGERLAALVRAGDQSVR